MAKTKQDYINAGKSDAQHGWLTAVPRGESWQSKAYYQGYDSVGIEKPIAFICPWYSTVKNRFLGWHIWTKDGKEVCANPIKRKTHARNIAIKLGYRVIK